MKLRDNLKAKTNVVVTQDSSSRRRAAIEEKEKEEEERNPAATRFRKLSKSPEKRKTAVVKPSTIKRGNSMTRSTSVPAKDISSSGAPGFLGRPAEAVQQNGGVPDAGS